MVGYLEDAGEIPLERKEQIDRLSE